MEISFYLRQYILFLLMLKRKHGIVVTKAIAIPAQLWIPSVQTQHTCGLLWNLRRERGGTRVSTQSHPRGWRCAFS